MRAFYTETISVGISKAMKTELDLIVEITRRPQPNLIREAIMVLLGTYTEGFAKSLGVSMGKVTSHDILIRILEQQKAKG
jgi:hypothetical protein